MANSVDSEISHGEQYTTVDKYSMGEHFNPKVFVNVVFRCFALKLYLLEYHRSDP